MGVPGSGEDFLDDDGDGDEYIDTTAEEEPPRSATSSSDSQEAPKSVQRATPKRRVRIKPITAALAAKFPGVISILVTRSDGTQLLLVKGG
jgi:hypothetical protein